MNNSYLSLEGKVALVTGGSRGIGKAIALTLADAGADVVVSSRKLEDLKLVANEIRGMGRRALAVTAHGRESEDIRNLVETIKNEFGRIDILVNNAATNPAMGPIVDMEERMYDQIMDTNLKGYTLLSQLAAKSMISQGGGAIVNIASILGVTPGYGLGLYSISKAAIIMLTKSMAKELGEHNIRVNGIAPGYVQTTFSKALWSNEAMMKEKLKDIPLKRIAQPEEVGRTVLFLVSEASAYVTGQTIIMDGGASI
ncbi:glucose 1-dehydrogenase [Desulfosporosinus hippei]|uniref:NAD(P)-dependent dehydrogenase, short-chain alcohol dehydrogenase family n=1 Tax=Desulfosporosinus hippei DSM 8344 TaxID=1121419 RepID=A0A1G8KXB8_9FIRM|nr:glucose 1-dehydrogenase [Desulfosporosinus hippei]SDI47550.1 NAD(P)-dependent dehydrogenase, short-chain alcohol dehydrogenase family [Desulfosporosinus hippei DSM 8344]